MNLGCIDRTLERGETSKDLPRRETVVVFNLQPHLCQPLRIFFTFHPGNWLICTGLSFNVEEVFRFSILLYHEAVYFFFELFTRRSKLVVFLLEGFAFLFSSSNLLFILLPKPKHHRLSPFAFFFYIKLSLRVGGLGLIKQHLSNFFARHLL